MSKKVFLMGIGMLMLFNSIEFVQADSVCQEHTNYYYFSEIYNLSQLETLIANNNGTYVTKYDTYYPLVGYDVKSEGRVCLKNGNVVDGTDCVETKSLEEYFGLYKTAKTNGNTYKIMVDGKKSEYTQYNVGNTSYFVHGSWYDFRDDTTVDESVETDKSNTSVLADGSIFPSYTKLTFNKTNNSYFTVTVDRKITEEDLDGAVPFVSTDDRFDEALLSPTMYKIVYDVCNVEENPTTGNMLIAIVYIVGILALGYSAYYFVKYKKMS